MRTTHANHTGESTDSVIHPIIAKYDNVPIDESTPIGTLVRPSGRDIQRARDYWLSCGRSDMKSAAKSALDAVINRRGTLTAHTKTSQGYHSICVSWNDGGESNCLPYCVVTAHPIGGSR